MTPTGPETMAATVGAAAVKDRDRGLRTLVSAVLHLGVFIGILWGIGRFGSICVGRVGPISVGLVS